MAKYGLGAETTVNLTGFPDAQRAFYLIEQVIRANTPQQEAALLRIPVNRVSRVLQRRLACGAASDFLVKKPDSKAPRLRITQQSFVAQFGQRSPSIVPHKTKSFDCSTGRICVVALCAALRRYGLEKGKSVDAVLLVSHKVQDHRAYFSRPSAI
jgi:hypothetical protein